MRPFTTKFSAELENYQNKYIRRGIYRAREKKRGLPNKRFQHTLCRDAKVTTRRRRRRRINGKQSKKWRMFGRIKKWCEFLDFLFLSICLLREGLKNSHNELQFIWFLSLSFSIHSEECISGCHVQKGKNMYNQPLLVQNIHNLFCRDDLLWD